MNFKVVVGFDEAYYVDAETVLDALEKIPMILGPREVSFDVFRGDELVAACDMARHEHGNITLDVQYMNAHESFDSHYVIYTDTAIDLFIDTEMDHVVTAFCDLYEGTLPISFKVVRITSAKEFELFAGTDDTLERLQLIRVLNTEDLGGGTYDGRIRPDQKKEKGMVNHR